MVKSACIACTAGSYCEGLGNINPTGTCLAGYYCTTAATIPTQYQTVPGYYSLSGSNSMTPCSPGTYNDFYGQSVCINCPAGFNCPDSATVLYSMLCPKGSYCLAGTSNPLK